jgi:hypothetical protein
VPLDPAAHEADIVACEQVEQPLGQRRPEPRFEIETVPPTPRDHLGPRDRDAHRQPGRVQRPGVLGREHVPFDRDRGSLGASGERHRVDVPGMGDDFGPQPRDAGPGAQERGVVEGDHEHPVERIGGAQDLAEPLDQELGPFALLDLEEEAEPEPSRGVESLLERGDRRAGERRIHPAPGIEPAELVQAPVGNPALAVVAPAEQLVVAQHDPRVAGEQKVDLAAGGTEPGRGLERRQRVLGRPDRMAAMAADVAATGPGGERLELHGRLAPWRGSTVTASASWSEIAVPRASTADRIAGSRHTRPRAGKPVDLAERRPRRAVGAGALGRPGGNVALGPAVAARRSVGEKGLVGLRSDEPVGVGAQGRRSGFDVPLGLEVEGRAVEVAADQHRPARRVRVDRIEEAPGRGQPVGRVGVALDVNRGHEHGPARRRDRGQERHPAAHPTLAEAAVEPAARGLEANQCRPPDREAREDRGTVQAGRVAGASVPSPLARIAQIELDELDREAPAHPEPRGEVA